MMPAGRKAAPLMLVQGWTNGPNLDRAMRRFEYPSGESMVFEYYSNGKVFRHTDNLGQTFTFRYNDFRRETTSIDEAGRKETYLFNEYGQQIVHTRADGTRLTYDYTNADHPLSETSWRNALGYTTEYIYESGSDSAHIAEQQLPEGSTIRFTDYTGFDRPQRTIDAEGNVTI
jgi:YD repeat-containing protein